MKVRVGVVGALGRMGRTVCAAIAEDPELSLVAAVARSHDGERLSNLLNRGDLDVAVSTDLDVLRSARAQVAVDFTNAASAVASVRAYVANGIHAVVGTTGIDERGVEDLRTLVSRPGSPHVLIAPNFAISAVLMMHFSEIAARFLPDVEIAHSTKADAPSGTALVTARAIAAARQVTPASNRTEELPGARGADAGVVIHSVRLPGFVSSQEVIFGGVGQALVIRQDSFDRSGFMPGVVLAVKRSMGRSGLTVGLAKLLDFSSGARTLEMEGQ